MQKLCVDTGIQEFELPGGSLCFNPSDPNVYNRFLVAVGQVEQVEQELVQKAATLGEQDGAQAIALLAAADKQTKAALDDVFGADFDTLLQGVNLMAVARNGERVVTNLLDALRPIIEDGAKRFYADKATTAVAAAKRNRDRRKRRHG